MRKRIRTERSSSPTLESPDPSADGLSDFTAACLKRACRSSTDGPRPASSKALTDVSFKRSPYYRNTKGIGSGGKGNLRPPRPCRTPSPTLSERPPWRSPGCQNPTSSSSSLLQPRRRSPSFPRGLPSRPSSPSHRRLPSPVALDPAHQELIGRRIRRAQRARFYLLQRTGPHSFLIGGDLPEHKYKVVIGPQMCSCGHGPYCIHILFVMLRVLQLPDSDPRLFSKELKNFEVESLFTAYDERRSCKVKSKCAPDASSFCGAAKEDRTQENNVIHEESVSSSAANRLVGDDEEEICPICLLEMTDGEGLVACTTGCHNRLHHHCIAIWAEECCRQGEKILCPLCRTPWGDTLNHTSQAPVKYQGELSRDLKEKQSSQCASPSSSDCWRRSSKAPVARGRHGTASPVTQALERNFRRASPHRSRGSLSTENLSCSSGGNVVIPLEHKTSASQWAKVFGTDVVSCLFAKDWVLREMALRRLMHDVVQVLSYDVGADAEQRMSQAVHACASILALMVSDPVYKVYLACVRCLRSLLANLPWPPDAEPGTLQALLQPVLQNILLKCTDGNQRMSQLSIETLVEFAKGQHGELAVGSAVPGSQFRTASGAGGMEFLLQCILQDYSLLSVSWQWILGRLSVLDRLMRDFPDQFYLRYVPLGLGESGYKLENYNRLLTTLEFTFRALSSSHGTVGKVARRLFVFGSQFAMPEPAVYKQIVGMLSMLEPGLQTLLQKRMSAMSEHQGPRYYSQEPVTPTSGVGGVQRKIRSSSTVRKVTSPSPQREKSSPPRPNHLPLDSIGLHHKRQQTKWNQTFTPSKPNMEILSPASEVLDVFSPPPEGKDIALQFTEEVGRSSPDGAPMVPHTTPVHEAPLRCLDEEYQLGKSEADSEDLPLIPALFEASLVHLHGIDLEGGSDAEKEFGEYKEGCNWTRGPLLGTGAFSTCYQAWDLKTGSLMAVKQVSFCRNSDEEQEKVESGILEEIELMVSLSHPNIVRFLGVTKEGCHFNVFSEWMAGGSVATMLDRYGAFSEQVIIRYMQQVIAGVVFLHENHILHRDLKGANLLVDSTGRRLRIGDFGAAARLASRATIPGEFQGQVLGTVAFMAPEVLRGEDYGRSCDVWSIGCCLIEMATQNPPWDANKVSNHLALMFKIACSTIPPPIPDHLSLETQNLALQCLEVNAASRPSAKQLLSHPVFLGTVS
ncbi:unnamed protein product [Darwinula stevensoni]|uniref:Mitogen-activated protein kinase kinase kinase 1 n=1 Tax=Darwinula stevensoni TaxID=69355 RepID=A0A7R8XCF1_9CRUS|nr:unnamed protein product [Darwinula stevensoni]CAG0887474.1 unnamed protein product [Darwinula stevensoni]